MIDIKDISKWYGSFQVLTNCTTSIKKGEVVVVCGPSGSGKSTLIKCVNALEPFQKATSSSMVLRSPIRRRTCPSSARASGWSSSISSCFRT